MQKLTHPAQPARSAFHIAGAKAALLCGALATAHPALSLADPLADTTAVYVRKWQASRFGMFIHWGPVTLKGTEIGWSRGHEVPQPEYDALYKQFNPAGFSAKDWVGLAKAAGMQYITFVTKHHDGFCMFDSKYTDHDIMATPFHRDATQEIADECKRQGVRFYVYYSSLDWYQPDYPIHNGSSAGYALPAGQSPDFNRYVAYMKNQVTELVQKYEPAGFWFDGDWESPWAPAAGKGADIYRTLKQLRPSLVINSRLSGINDLTGVDDWAAWRTSNPRVGEYFSMEDKVGVFDDSIPWEACHPIAQQWAYSPANVPKPAKTLVSALINVIGGDGNFLLNLGPGPDGKMVAGEAARLLEMGSWVNAHGAGIYGTRGGPFKPAQWGGATYKGNLLYLHIVNWSGATQAFPALRQKILSARLVGGTGTVQFTQSPSGLNITVPTANRDSLATTVELTLDAAVNADKSPIPVSLKNRDGGILPGSIAKPGKIFDLTGRRRKNPHPPHNDSQDH